ncbi:ribonuclease E [Kribbella sp. VKM Ac-2571]|uniref:Rne/Rng family ribonuclease n=1 Tax=Kribbella sp. VKM Ac-2571 TaxID=2512222 RepID=UPI001060472C|nr:Rne/Rng family ribonuclease [Kribbella sp. VKM Ac-2571]TDO69170.1 ribonuclease E [Kribbella sp. VKM Ac-2571]
MLDNEPTTEAAGTAAPAQSAATRKTAKTAAAKKTTTTRKRAAKKTAEPAAEAAEPAKKTAAKATAKKAPAKKAAAAPAKKAAAAKKTAKRTTKKAASQDTFPELFAPPAETPAETAAEAEPTAPAKKTTRKRTTKKTAATPTTDASAADSASTASAPADATATTGSSANPGAGDHAGTSGAGAAEAPATKRSSRRRTTKSAAAAADSAASDAPTTAPDAQTAAPVAQTAPDAAAAANVETQAEEPSARRTRRRPAAAPVLFQAPTDVPQPDEPATAKTTQPKASQARSGQSKTAQPAQAETAAVDAAAAEPGADEQPTGTRRRRSRRGRDAEARDTAAEATTDDAPQTVSADQADGEADAKPEGRSSRRTRTRTHVETAANSDDTDETTDADAEAADSSDGQGEDGEEGTRRRRRRRGGRRRRKSGDADGADDSADEQSDDDQDDESEQDTDAQAADSDADAEADTDEDGEAGGSSTRRRRRRRRRKGEDSAASPDDPDETVVRVREPRSKNSANEVTAIEGSTRLEAKKQRRREGRAAGRRRAPIVTEAEFLARRESVERTMVIRSREDVTQIAVTEDNVLVEHYVTTAEQTSLIGNVYLGRVQNVLPSMEAAFIDIGKGRNAVLYAGEVDWATLGGANGPRKIEQVLKSGQSVLVQVTKDPIGHKGARLTNQISLPGRYVVYVPRGGNGGISRKLPDTERNRLKTILKDIVPDEAGVIVRTAAEGASEEELTSDVSRLQTAWEEIDKLSKNGQAPQLLYGEPDLLIRVVRDLFTEDFAKLVVSGDRAYDQVREYVEGVAPHLVERVEKAHSDVFSDYRIDEQIKKALDRKVWLPSGGSLVIDRTEAMTVVDVNTGKFTGSGGNLEETVTKNNLEAAEEIVRQLRLRDIGGIIVIDFIDMVLESNRDLVLRRLVECLGRDRTKHQVAEVTSLGLVQMTRKRIGTGLLEAFSENCDHCGGRGLILHDEPKESRRRDGRNGQNNGQHNGNGHQEQKPAQAEEGGRKSSRRRRGKGRGDDEQATEPEAPQHNHDAAQKLAQIAAASAKADEHEGEQGEQSGGTPEPTGYPVSAGADEHVSPEATGFPAPETASAASDTVEATDAAPNGAPKSTRRRRSSRSRSKTATDSETTEPSELVTTGS